MFRINTNELKRLSSRIENEALSLLKHKNVIEEICTELSSLSGMEALVSDLRDIAEDLNKESQKTKNLADASSRIAFKYEQAESRIIEHSDNACRGNRGGSISLGKFGCTEGMDPKLKDTLGDIDKLIR